MTASATVGRRPRLAELYGDAVHRSTGRGGGRWGRGRSGKLYFKALGLCVGVSESQLRLVVAGAEHAVLHHRLAVVDNLTRGRPAV